MNGSIPISQPERASFNRRVTGSLLSAAAGWASLNLVGLVIYLCTESGSGRWRGPLLLAAYSAAFIFPAWLLALLPLYLLVPPQSVLWRWPVCMACGALAGGGIMLLAALVFWPSARLGLESLIVPAFVGAVSCLFASLTSRHFRNDRNA